MTDVRAQQRWFRRLRKCIDEMPDDTMIIVRHGYIELVDPGEREAAFQRHGHIDSCEAIDSFNVSRGKVEPASEGM